MSITRAQIATQLLNEMAPKGEKLAYINNREAELLKRMGGAGVDINKTGIKSYFDPGSGRGSVSESLSQAAFGSRGPTFSSDGGGSSYDYIPQPTVAKLNTITTPGDGTYVNPNKTVIETLRDANFLSNFQRKGIDRFLADQYARKVDRLAPYVVGDMDKDYYFGDLKTAADLGLKNAPTTLPGGKTDIPGTAKYLAFNTIGLPALGLQSLTNLLDKALAPPATLEGALATRDKMQNIYGDIGKIGQTQFENKYMNNPPPTIGGGDNQPIRLPIIAEAPSDVESTPSDFDLYAALEGRQGMRFGENPYAIKGATQRFSDGGLASLRQAYGLGKLVKKATNAVKKIAKSDLGKAALIAAGTYALGGGGNPFTAAGRGKFAFANIPGYLKAKNFIGDNSMMKDINKLPGYVKYGIPAVSLASYFASKKANEDENTLDDEIAQKYRDTSGLREQLATYKPFRFQVPKEYQLPYAADGGRIGYQNAGSVNSNDQDLFERFIKEREKYFKNQDKENLLKDFEQFKRNEEPTMAAQGGRIGYEIGGDIDPADLPMSKEGFPRYEDESGEEVPYPYDNQEMASDPDPMAELFQMYLEAIRSGQIPRSTTFDQYKELMGETTSMSPERTMANEGGLMNLGGNEMDLRGGGFVPIGVKEKADDVPARLSKNEFVFTADAVRAAGGGDVDTGADLMYKTMKNLESRVG
jgi:hypothetical protein